MQTSDDIKIAEEQRIERDLRREALSQANRAAESVIQHTEWDEDSDPTTPASVVERAEAMLIEFSTPSVN